MVNGVLYSMLFIKTLLCVRCRATMETARHRPKTAPREYA
jgi:hypothetical protein